MEKTAVEFIVKELIKLGYLHSNDYGQSPNVTKVIEQAKEMEKQKKIEYKISTPLGHVSHMIEKYGIDATTEEYKNKVINHPDSDFWKECLKISEFYKQTFNK